MRIQKPMVVILCFLGAVLAGSAFFLNFDVNPKHKIGDVIDE